MGLSFADKLFYKVHHVSERVWGVDVKYYYTDDEYVQVKAVKGSKRVPVQQQNGLLVLSKFQYYAIDGSYLVTNDSPSELITPKRQHFIIQDGIRWSVVNPQGAYFNSPVPSNSQAGLLTIFVIQETDTQQ